MNTYTSSSTQWPVMQSLTEQKQKSGLLTCSAEFIRPVGNSALPSSIETSIGIVPVWPEPVISIGTDGFEKINATGYGVWDANLTELVTGRAATSFEIRAQSRYLKADPDTPTPQPKFPLEISSEFSYSKKIYCIFENASICKINSFPTVPSLKILNLTGADISGHVYNALQEFPELAAQGPWDWQSPEPRALQRTTICSQARENKFGPNISQNEFGFEIITDGIDFGMFSRLI